jgi:inhibitor of KinA
MFFQQISTNSLLISFSNEISKEISIEVQTAYANIKSLNDISIYELIPSYTSIFISYDIFKYSYSEIKNLLQSTILKSNNLDINDEIITIDVYYGKEVGLDLNRISLEKNIDINQIIDIHSSVLYDVYAIGFLPGFGFLGEVDKQIATPRLSTPRKKVLKGSVAIANTQTAVYPKDSAGGWNIIGSTTKNLFDITLKKLSPLSIGKKVKFNPITKYEYLRQGGKL